MSEESSIDSEGFDTACEGEVEDIEETKKLECNCEKWKKSFIHENNAWHLWLYQSSIAVV